MKKLLTLIFAAVSFTSYSQISCQTTPVNSVPYYNSNILHNLCTAADSVEGVRVSTVLVGIGRTILFYVSVLRVD